MAIPLGGDHYFAAAVGDVAHRFKGIDHKIEQDLLQLNRVGLNRRQIRVQQSLHLAGMKYSIPIYHANHARYKIVQIHPLPGWSALSYHVLDASNHITGTASIRHDISEKFTKLAKIDMAAFNKALSRAGVADDCRERLIQFMGNGGR